MADPTSSIKTSLDGIADALTHAGIKTYPFDARELPARPPVATLYVDALTPGKSDQSGRTAWKKIDAILRYYVSVKQQEQAAQRQMWAGCESILAALAGDARVGGAVINLLIPEDGTIPIRVDITEMLLVAEWRLEVTPWQIQPTP